MLMFSMYLNQIPRQGAAEESHLERSCVFTPLEMAHDGIWMWLNEKEKKIPTALLSGMQLACNRHAEFSCSAWSGMRGHSCRY